MTKIKLDHVYVSVKEMDRAVKFYEDLVGMKVTHIEEDTWADFDDGKGFYLRRINPKIISKKRKLGNNCTPVFWTDKVDELYKKIIEVANKNNLSPNKLKIY